MTDFKYYSIYNAGICTSDLMKCETKCPETRICYLQERCFDLSESEDTILNAVVVLQQVLRIFPNLFALIFDWNIVEPFDERSVEIVKKLIDIYRFLLFNFSKFALENTAIGLEF